MSINTHLIIYFYIIKDLSIISILFFSSIITVIIISISAILSDFFITITIEHSVSLSINSYIAHLNTPFLLNIISHLSSISISMPILLSPSVAIGTYKYICHMLYIYFIKYLYLFIVEQLQSLQQLLPHVLQWCRLTILLNVTKHTPHLSF